MLFSKHLNFSLSQAAVSRMYFTVHSQSNSPRWELQIPSGAVGHLYCQWIHSWSSCEVMNVVHEWLSAKI